jgi:hypothetical protein
LPLCVSAQGAISTNKEFVLNSGSSGTTVNALPPDETNFFAVNSNLLNQSVAASSGAGGGGALNFATNNLNAVITNNEAGNVTLNGAILSVGGATRLDSSAIFTDGTGDMQINGSLNVSQADGSPNHIDGNAGGVNIIARQEAFDVWGYGAPGADYDLDLGVFAVSNYEGYSVIIGSHGSIQYSSVWQPWTNVTGVASPYSADRGDLQIVDNMSAESGNKEIMLPQATVMFADTEQNDINWTFVRDGAALGPAYYDRWYSIYNLGSNTAHTLSVCTADHIAFTNYGGQVNGTNIQIPNMTKAVFTTFGTNGVVELSPLGPYNAYGSGLSNAIYSIGQANGWGSGGGSGTVISVAAAADSANVVSWSGSPITSGGTLTPTFAKMSSSQFGVGKADGSSITASSGVLSVGSVAGLDITGTIPASALQFATNNANTMVTNNNAGAVQLNGGLNIIGNLKTSGTFTSDNTDISSSGTGNLTAFSFLAVNTPGYAGDGSGLTGLRYPALVVTDYFGNLTTVQCLNGSGSTGTGAGISNWAPNLYTNTYWFVISNNICLTNDGSPGQYLNMPAQHGDLDLMLRNTNAAATYYISWFGLGASNFNGGLTNDWPLTNSQGWFHFHMTVHARNFSNSVWEGTNPQL